jgi:Mg-chelatase subunit ChlD
MSTSLVPGSLGAVATRNNTSIAESFLAADVIILVDSSGSMDAHDSRGGQSRFQVALDELTRLQADLPGKLAVVGFSSTVRFAPDGLPVFKGGGTNLSAALRFVAPADGTVRFIVVSDGQPDSPQECLQIVSSWRSRIDTVYVGPESERSGALFLEQLARAAGGKAVRANRACELAERVEALLLTGR